MYTWGYGGQLGHADNATWGEQIVLVAAGGNHAVAVTGGWGGEPKPYILSSAVRCWFRIGRGVCRGFLSKTGTKVHK